MRYLIRPYYSYVLTIPYIALAQVPEAAPPFQPKLITTLKAQDSVAMSYPVMTPQFRPLGLSVDGKFLLISATEVGDRLSETSAIRLATAYLHFVNLETGETSLLAQTKGDMGFDWFAGMPGFMGALQVTTQQPESGNELPWITLGAPTNQPPPNDVIESFTPDKFEGKAVYVAFVRVAGTGDQSQWRTFLVLRRAGENINTVQTYPVQLRRGELFLPQWSPDGKTILLKVGNAGDRYNVYLMHLWNPETGELYQGPSDYISHLMPRWSPDSQHIAYIIGGDTGGRIDPFTDLRSLHIYDLRTRQSRILVHNLGSADFAWTRTNTLLYTPPNSQFQPVPSQIILSRPVRPRPNIYEVGITGGIPSLLISDGSKPTPSPDGRLVAFFGWPEEEEARAEAKDNPAATHFGARLMLFDRTTKQRILVSPDVFELGTQLLWTPDSKRLGLIQTRYDSQNMRGEARISAVSVLSE